MPGKKPKYWLNAQEVDSILGFAKRRSTQFYLIFLLCRWGFRIGEIVGHDRLPGMYARDLRERGFWLIGKKNTWATVPAPVSVVEQLRQYIFDKGLQPDDKLFWVSERWCQMLTKQFARAVGIREWEKVSPHRLRAFTATDAKDKGMTAFEIRDIMRHSNISTTNLYVGHATPEKVGADLDKLDTA